MNILTFKEFLNEANTNKKQPFNSFVKETYNLLIKTPNIVSIKKPQITTSGKESAFFNIRTKPLSNERSSIDDNETYKKFFDRMKKYRQSVLLLLNCPPNVLKKDLNTYKNVVHKIGPYSDKFSDTIEDTFTDTKNGFKINVKTTFFYDRGYYYIDFDVDIEGNKVSAAQTSFTEFPEFVPGAILHATWGYNMTINTFYEIIRRTNKTIYAVEIGKKNIDGSGLSGHEIPDPSIREKEVFSGRLTGGNYVKLDGHYCSLYDGKPAYYNSMD